MGKTPERVSVDKTALDAFIEYAHTAVGVWREEVSTSAEERTRFDVEFEKRVEDLDVREVSGDA